METTKNTIEYYNSNHINYVEETINASMEPVLSEFVSYISTDQKILDLGCGSGRDTLYFMKAGYSVVSVDGSDAMCNATYQTTGKRAILSTFEEYDPSDMFGGIWANASLLHLSDNVIKNVVSRLSQNLIPGGCFYMSFKLGDFSGERNGRFFNDFTDSKLRNLLKDVSSLECVKTFVTFDVRKERKDEKWLNALYQKQ